MSFTGQVGNAQVGNAQVGGIGANINSTIEVPISDSLSLFDIIGYFKPNATSGAIVILLTDSTQNEAGLLDSFSENVGIPIQKTESISLSDVITEAQVVAQVPSDSLNLSDTVSSRIVGILSVVPTDSISFSDSFGSGNPGKLTTTVFDFISLNDSINRSANLKVPVSDTLTFFDKVFNGEGGVGNLLYIVIVSDSVSLSDSVTPTIGILRSSTDTISLSESNSLGSGPTGLPLSDSLVLSDLTTLLGTTSISKTDSLALSDLITLFGTLSTAALSDSLSLSDNLTALIQSVAPTLSLSDVLILSDIVAVALTSSKLQFSDSISLIDFINVQLIVDFNSYLRQYLNDVPGISNP